MKSTYKYLQLNAEVHFKEVVSEARAVILAGGTLQPVRFINLIFFFIKLVFFVRSWSTHVNTTNNM